MHKAKKKSKIVKLPKPIKVKKEKSDEDRLPQPMTHYLDDRLEMVKQIFNTLKPKTIVNLAPDFLKTQALEEIEEACLNELLCISTKRLKSIITASKCPTDTESSDNDSDVERHEEHISLEEISSDSEIDGCISKKARKKKPFKVGEETDATKKNAPTEENQEDGQISVLELLELQARARAIRSQLALEPVTKIEVDSDEEKRKNNENGKSKKNDDKANKNDRKRVSSERESKLSQRDDSLESPNTTESTENKLDKNISKKIKLKRNYRNTTNKESEGEINAKRDTETVKADTDKNNKLNIKAPPKHKAKNALINDIKKEKTSRSPSPDVIPIVAEPETLLVADSSEDEKILRNKKEALKAALDQANDEQETQKEETNTEKATGTEKEGVENSSAQQINKDQHLPEENSTEVTKTLQFGMNDKNEVPDRNPKTKSNKISNKEKSKSNEGINSVNHSDEDQNDDVISLGGDLENEMNEQLENEVNVMQSSFNKKSTEDSSQDNIKSQEESLPEDIISLESSGDEQANDNQSWHSRYMKSSKVSKVLAASRLGKRVRDKIKKSKNSKKDALHENSEGDKEKSTTEFTSKHEDGSVEQYKELLEMRQRKSS